MLTAMVWICAAFVMFSSLLLCWLLLAMQLEDRAAEWDAAGYVPSCYERCVLSCPAWVTTYIAALCSTVLTAARAAVGLIQKGKV